jgi:hypothetical protein
MLPRNKASSMSTIQDLEDARELFIREFDGNPATANRIADVLRRAYERDALAQPREIVLEAASWAAAKLRALPAERLFRIGEREVISLLNQSDCPLCIGGSSGRSGTGGTPITTNPPPRVPVYPMDVLRT